MDGGGGVAAAPTAKRTRFALREPLKLGDGELPGSVVQVLTPHQLEGIRFIYRGLQQNKGVILNDESGLGKTHQVIGYLSAAVGPADKAAIVCDSLQRVHHWLYHLESLTELKACVLSGDGEIDQLSDNQRIIVSTFGWFERHSATLLPRGKDINLLVIDETKDVQCEIGFLTLVAKFPTANRIFLTTENLLDDSVRLSVRLKLCHVQFHGEALNLLLEDAIRTGRPLSKSKKLQLFFLTRTVLFRRYRSHHKRWLPLIAESEFRSGFNAWKIANGMECSQIEEGSLLVLEESQPELAENVSNGETSLNTALVGDVESSGIGRDLSHETDGGENEGIVSYKISEPLFDFEQSTEDMPKLVVESSDSETKSTLDENKKNPLAKASESEKARSQTPNIEIPETEHSSQATEDQTDSEGYLQFGQALVQPTSQLESSSDTFTRKSITPLTEDKYNFPIDRFLQRPPSSSSTDLEIVSKESVIANNPVLVSSCSSNGREKSPDLFSDSDDDTVKAISPQDDSLLNLLLKSPVEVEKVAEPDVKVPTTLSKFPRTNVSTPISKLLHGPLQDVPANSTSSNDIFADLTVKNPDPNRTDVFEITDNNAFGNQILVHAEKDSMSPLRDSDDVQFVSVLRPPDGPVEILDLDTNDVCSTPKSQNGPAPNPLKRTTTPSSSRGSLPATPRGWLTKSNRSSDSDSPRTPKTSHRKTTPRSGGGERRSTGSHTTTSGFKRKRLENWFRDAPTDEDDDDFEDCRRASTSVNRRKSAPVGGGSGGRRISPRKKCFQERIIQRYNQILVSPSGMDSDFE